MQVTQLKTKSMQFWGKPKISVSNLISKCLKFKHDAIIICFTIQMSMLILLYSQCFNSYILSGFQVYIILGNHIRILKALYLIHGSRWSSFWFPGSISLGSLLSIQLGVAYPLSQSQKQSSMEGIDKWHKKE